ncbi:HAAS signaling domain-containing protein [Kribbella sp. CA-253562]|uniref:HAAS signaling domain-containing protein n=1 Tax=Kribbella sp. CA-253562 TaxID=3239942 RepID=UPI003D8AE378
MSVKHGADELVDAYLAYLRRAAEPLPEIRRAALVMEVESQIAEERAAVAESPEQVKAILARIGDPDDLVAARTEGLVLVDRIQPRYRSRDVAALLLLPFGGFVALVGWLAGVALLWTSDRWTREEKILGTLVLPFGYLPVAMLGNLYGRACRTDPEGAILSCGAYSHPEWFLAPVLIALSAAPLAMLFVLVKTARPGRSTAPPG